MNYLEQQTEQLLEQRTEKFIKDSLFSDEVLDMISENMRPIDTLMSYYKCASMEVETKFKVLSIEFNGKCPDVEIAFYHASFLERQSILHIEVTLYISPDVDIVADDVTLDDGLLTYDDFGLRDDSSFEVSVNPYIIWR